MGAPAHADRCDAPDAGSVRVVTLNTWGLPSPLAPDRRGRLPRLERRLREAAHDLVGLQEIWSGARPLFSGDLHVVDGDGDAGLALMTPHEPAGLELHRFRSATGFDTMKQKGFLVAHVDIPDVGPVHVVVTHLQAGRGRRARRVRADQIAQILEHLAGVREPVVLMGDLNLYEGDPVDARTERMLADAGLVDAARSLGAAEPTYPAQSARLDRVYVRCGDATCVHPQAARVLASYEPLSDHLPLRVDLHAHPRTPEHHP